METDRLPSLQNLDGKISYRELVEALAKDSYTTEQDQHFSVPAVASAAVDVGYKKTAKRVQSEANDVALTNAVVDAFTKAFVVSIVGMTRIIASELDTHKSQRPHAWAEQVQAAPQNVPPV